ncbi:hypothetical protein V2J09_023842 [Rumex salicifolius]
MAAPLFLIRGFSLPIRLQHNHSVALRLFAQLRRPFNTTADESTRSVESAPNIPSKEAVDVLKMKEPPQLLRLDGPNYRVWKDSEEEILREIEPITLLAKEILHSKRYRDGERLTAEDEKAVLQKILAYHPHADAKIGCGFDSIMVDRHPLFRHSRCLFVVRTDGGWIDFSYQKCIREYIRYKFPSYAERFIREHFKRGSVPKPCLKSQAWTSGTSTTTTTLQPVKVLVS